jgi:hypothetical protein
MNSPKGRAVSGTPTGERARSGGSARADLSVARTASVGAPLPSFSLVLFSFVIAGIAVRRTASLRSPMTRQSMGHCGWFSLAAKDRGTSARVKPSGDEENASLFEIAISNLANRNQRMRRALP